MYMYINDARWTCVERASTRRTRPARLKEVSIMHTSKRTLKLKENKKQRRGTYIDALPIIRCCFEIRSFTQYQIEANRIGSEL